jgi:hypothetical protein
MQVFYSYQTIKDPFQPYHRTKTDQGVFCTGQTHLNAEEAKDVGVVPSRIELFAFDASLFTEH